MQEPRKPLVARSPGPHSERRRGPQPVTILVVDDVSDTRRMYASYFEHAGAATLVAVDGAEALRAIRDHRPDAVLLDLSMPGTDGWQVLAALGRSAAKRRPVVVALTGHADGETKDLVLDAGADLYLTKPCLPHVALGFITQLLNAEEAPKA